MKLKKKNILRNYINRCIENDDEEANQAQTFNQKNHEEQVTSLGLVNATTEHRPSSFSSFRLSDHQ